MFNVFICSPGYYALSLPTGVTLMFPFGAGLGVAGFWCGQLLAQTVLALLLLIYQFCAINWDKEVTMASQRISSSTPTKTYGATASSSVGPEAGVKKADDEAPRKAKRGVAGGTERRTTKEVGEEHGVRDDGGEGVTASTFCLATPSNSLSQVTPDATLEAAPADPQRRRRDSEDASDSRERRDRESSKGGDEKGSEERRKQKRREICRRVTFIVVFTGIFIGVGIVVQIEFPIGHVPPSRVIHLEPNSTVFPPASNVTVAPNVRESYLFSDKFIVLRP